jgi:hypothetical protein
MARNRTPKNKANVSGASLNQPSRYAQRQSPKSVRALGDPYEAMTNKQKEVWQELRYEMPWLTSSDRTMVRLACMWIAKLDDGEFGTAATQVLSAILSKLGASPSDVSKVNHATDEEKDESDKFFKVH